MLKAVLKVCLCQLIENLRRFCFYTVKCVLLKSYLTYAIFCKERLHRQGGVGASRTFSFANRAFVSSLLHEIQNLDVIMFRLIKNRHYGLNFDWLVFAFYAVEFELFQCIDWRFASGIITLLTPVSSKGQYRFNFSALLPPWQLTKSGDQKGK